MQLKSMGTSIGPTYPTLKQKGTRDGFEKHCVIQNNPPKLTRPCTGYLLVPQAVTLILYFMARPREIGWQSIHDGTLLVAIRYQSLARVMTFPVVNGTYRNM